eukprot:PhM_4_TR12269/c0_g1_i2/m.52997/K04392/RAC1; Ras-related C3 botulinum toxin substrate 1
MSGTPQLRQCKCVVVGDGTVGKTCLSSVYAHKGFPTKYTPTIFDNYCARVDVDGTPMQLVLWDTAGQEEFDKLRPLSYPNTHVFILCFAVDSQTTFDNISSIWVSELRPYLESAKIVLVGTKSDLRNDPEVAATKKFVTPEQAEALRAEIGAYRYVECSALKNVNVKTVFDEAIRARFTLPDMASEQGQEECPATTAPTPTPAPAPATDSTPARATTSNSTNNNGNNNNTQQQKTTAPAKPAAQKKPQKPQQGCACMIC